MGTQNVYYGWKFKFEFSKSPHVVTSLILNRFFITLEIDINTLINNLLINVFNWIVEVMLFFASPKNHLINSRFQMITSENNLFFSMTPALVLYLTALNVFFFFFIILFDSLDIKKLFWKFFKCLLSSLYNNIASWWLKVYD